MVVGDLEIRPQEYIAFARGRPLQLTVRELVRSIAKSPEHIRRFMSRGITTDVTYAYKHLLGRAPDPEGQRSHEQLRTAENSAAVIDSLIDSNEYQQSFSDDTVPGSRLRYCGPAGPAGATSRMRFPNMDTNRNGAIELRTEAAHDLIGRHLSKAGD